MLSSEPPQSPPPLVKIIFMLTRNGSISIPDFFIWFTTFYYRFVLSYHQVSRFQPCRCWRTHHQHPPTIPHLTLPTNSRRSWRAAGALAVQCSHHWFPHGKWILRLFGVRAQRWLNMLKLDLNWFGTADFSTWILSSLLILHSTFLCVKFWDPVGIKRSKTKDVGLDDALKWGSRSLGRFVSSFSSTAMGPLHIKRCDKNPSTSITTDRKLCAPILA